MEQPIFRQAETALHLISGDPEARQLAEDREKARINYLSAMDGAGQFHRKEGKAEGKAEMFGMVAQSRFPGLSQSTLAKIDLMTEAELNEQVTKIFQYSDLNEFEKMLEALPLSQTNK